MERAEIEARAQGIIIREWGVDPERITSDALLGADLKGDSLDVVKLNMSAEEEFSVTIPNERDGCVAAGTFGNFCDLIESLIAERCPT